NTLSSPLLDRICISARPRSVRPLPSRLYMPADDLSREASALRRNNFHLANFTARIRFSVEIYVAANRVFDVSKRLFNVRTLRMASRQFRTTNRYAFVVL